MGVAELARISVAMCTWNGTTHLREQLESLGAQTRLPWELVVCDDGSTDETEASVRQFAEIAPFAVRFVRSEARLGSSKNFEKCLGLCGGELIALADQDDFWEPEKLARQAAVLEADAAVSCVFSNALLMDKGSRLTGEDAWARFLFTLELQRRMAGGDAAGVLLRLPVVTGATMMLRALLLEKALPIGTAWVHDGWLAWMAALYGRLAFVEEPLVRYRIHAEQQLGLPVESGRKQVRAWGLRATLRQKKAGQAASYRLAAEQYGELAAVVEVRGLGDDATRQALWAKAEFSTVALEILERPRGLRVFSALAHTREYGRFTPRGLQTILYDALL